MNEHQNNFTLLRLILATLVVFGHFRLLPGNPPVGIFSFADFAIDAFFVVSGYLVYESFDRQPVIGAFYLRRIFRIYPLYLCTIFVQGVVMALLLGDILMHIGDLLRYLGPNLIMANFLAYDMGGLLKGLHNPGINPSLWTLKIELAFYFLLPFLWILMRRWKNSFLLLLYIASTAYFLLATEYGTKEMARQLPGQLRFFAAGILMYCQRDALRNIPMPAVVALLLACFALCTQRHELWLTPIYPLCSALMVFLFAERLWAAPLPYDISYGVYLFHGPLIQLALLLGIFQDSRGFLLVLVAVVYMLAFAASSFIEKPGIRLGKCLSSAWMQRRIAEHAA